VREGRTCGPGCNGRNCENTNQLTMTMDEVEGEERQEDLTARKQYRSELVEDDDEDYAEDMQTDDLEEDGEVYDDYDG